MIESSTALISRRFISIGSSKKPSRIQTQRSNYIPTSDSCRRAVNSLPAHRRTITSVSSKLIDEETMKASKKAKIKSEDSDDEDFVSPEEQTEEDYINSLPEGLSKGHHIISYGTVPATGFPMEQLLTKLKEDEIKRLEITPTNVNVPVALMLLFPQDFGTLTRARKECRRKKILVLRCEEKRDEVNTDVTPVFARDRMIIGKVIDRV